jgi:dsDNA-binding SOS-regulon protein
MSAEKPYKIEMEDRGGYLWVLVGGETLNATIAAMYWNEIAEACFEKGIDKILIEKDFPESVSPDQMLQMAEHLSKILPTRRVAFVDRHNHASINELGKRLARNRDVMMQLFSDIGEAEKWLLAN